MPQGTQRTAGESPRSNDSTDGQAYSALSVGTTLFEYDERRDRYVEWYCVDKVFHEEGVSAILSRGDTWTPGPNAPVATGARAEVSA